MDVAATLQECGSRTQGLVTAAHLARAGVSRSRLSRSLQAGEVVRVRPRVYALAPLPPLPRYVVTHEGVALEYVAHVRALLLSLGPSAVAGGRTAAALFGWPLLVEPLRSLEVVVPHGRSHLDVPRVLVLRHRAIAHLELHVPGAGPLSTTTPVQTLIDCALRRPLREAVVIWDSALRAGHVTLVEVARAQHLVRGIRPAARLRRVAALAADDSGSVPETVFRLRLLAAGMAFRTQYPIRTRDGRHLLRADFCWPDVRLVVEVDGARWHADSQKDQRTDNALAAAGWRVMRFPGSEVVRDGDGVLEQVQRALTAGVRATAGSQRWQDSAA